MSACGRRRFLKALAACGAAFAGRADAAAEEASFMADYGVPGFSYAIARNGKIVRRRAFGLADLAAKTMLTTEHRFRIASVSKPITSAAAFLLRKRGKLDLDGRVFGTSGYLRDFAGPEGITVRHLLTHTSGGWRNDASDPMFKHPDYGHAKLIAWALKALPPGNPPGESYAYSNFGYCLLGRIIEKVSGQTYESFVRDNILRPCGSEAMRLGDRAPGDGEAGYFMNGKPVAPTMNIRRMDAHGGWVGTPAEMVRFALRVDGFDSPADMLEKASLSAMTERTGPNPSYACGWSVNKAGNWWHTGSLPGLTSLLVRTAGGDCWAACANTRAEGIGLALDRLMWRISSAM